MKRELKLYEGPSWHWRWMYAATAPDNVLHRMRATQAKVPDGYETSLDARTVCGRLGRWHMPGFLSRLGRQRCAACCKRLGIPRGAGAPANAKTKWRDA